MKKLKQILAITAIILLVGLYVMTLVFALSGMSGWFDLLMASVGATIMLPLLIWLLLRMIDRKKGDE